MYNFIFTTITPLHISNGETLDQYFHYTTFKDEVYKIDHKKLSKIIAKKEKIDFTSDINSKIIESWIQKHQLEIIGNASSYSVKINQSFLSHLNNPRVIGRRQIIEFINSNGSLYIPASSVKGALLTPLNIDLLGINPIDPNINDKVVFHDSEFLDSSKFSVYRTENRPPENNLICLDPGITFTLIMRQKGRFSKNIFLNNLKNYTQIQLENLNREVTKFKSNRIGKVRKADLFLKAINEINYLANKGEHIINIGYGGGSWFKIQKNRIPKFKSKIPGKKHIEEAAHSSFSFTIKGGLTHIGWCKLKIEEE